MKPLLAQFLAEADDLLAPVGESLLRLRRNPDDRTAADTMFRAAHTLRASSGLFDLPELTRLAHAIEDRLAEVRSDRPVPADDLQTGFDQIRGWLTHVAAHGRLPVRADISPVRRTAPPRVLHTVADEPGEPVESTPLVMVGVAGQRFGIPAGQVTETIRVPPTGLGRVLGRDVVVSGDTVLPVLDLARALRLSDAPPPPDGCRTVLVTRVGGRRAGLLVQRLHGTCDVPLRPMEGLLTPAAEFAGTALPGDGPVLLVLNLTTVLDRAEQSWGRTEPP
ncbi:chemotaxis protein CheW [Actinoplanes palleronii]|uniref:histidine kinase n=1 Tax=Actinoplanes palleronii TaxID=113570 RepID=A0ABQ4B4W4_9ACTN|nr:chemotaxis protein CheW [Actinoplanes palleronii]GIE65699.1 hypothetical protein Apa02nite_018070 [Actinoplanes palleronii]